MSLPYEEKFVNLSHGKTRYFEAGDGAPLILLHGVSFAAGSESWLLNIEALSQHCRVIAPDVLGWGVGDKLTQPYSFAYLVDFVRELQDGLGLAKSHLLGHSMGGWLASLFAYESPERVDKLVLVASGGVATRPLAVMSGWKPPSTDDLTHWFDPAADAGFDVAPMIADRIKRSQDPTEVDGFGKIMAHMTNPETRARYNTVRRLPHISAETLVLWGSEDEVNSVELGRQTQELIPNATIQVFEGRKHFLPIEIPAEFNAAVANFLSA